MQHWSSIKEKSAGFFRLRFMLLIYKIFGRSILQIFIYPVVFFTILFSKKLRESSRQYLNQIHLTDKSFSTVKPNITHIFKHVFSFANSLVDKIESWSGSVNLSKLNIKNQEVFNELVEKLESKTGVILIGSHLGNIELFRALGNINASKIIKNNLKINAIVQSNYTAHFNKLLTQINKNASTNLISATQIDVEQTIILSDKLQNGEIIVITGDRSAQNNQSNNLAVDFLGKKAEFPIGPIAMANIMKAPTYFIFCLKNKGCYDIHLQEVDLKPQSSRKEQKENIPFIIKDYAKILEKLCLQYPYQWFNFFNFWK